MYEVSSDRDKFYDHRYERPYVLLALPPLLFLPTALVVMAHNYIMPASIIIMHAHILPLCAR